MTHAAGESVESRVSTGTNAIVLAVSNESQLCILADKLSHSELKFTLINEPDAPYNGALMAIGITPILRSVGRKYFSSLPLIKDSMFRAGSSEKERIVFKYNQDGGLIPS